MDSDLLEVKSGVVRTWDGESLEVQGGAYLSPEAYLSSTAELERLRRLDAERDRLVPALVVSAALLGAAVGYWFARRLEEDD